MRILLVEDEPAAAQVLAKGLREQTYAVDVAAAGDAAVFQVGTTDYAPGILDVWLAGRAGSPACRPVDVVSRSDISEHVWDERHDPVSNVVDVYVQRLRRKIDHTGAESLIRTRRGEGYQLLIRAAP